MGALRKPKAGVSKKDSVFTLAVVVPAHNEEQLIGRCIASLQAASVEALKTSIFVIADNCSDLTADRARAAGADVLVRTNQSERGKGFALRYAFDYLMPKAYDGVAVIDADSIVSNNCLREIVGALELGAQAAQTRYRVAKPLNTQRKRLMDVAFCAFNVLRPKGRDGLALSAGILGNGFAISRQTLTDVPYLAESIVEDLEYHLMLIAAGKRVQFLDKATVFGDIPEDSQSQETQRARWEGGRLRLALTKSVPLIRQLLQGHTLVFEPLLEILTLPLAYLTLLLTALLAMPVTAYRLYALTVLGVLFAHVLTALALSGEMNEGLSALMSAPSYVFWKLTKSLAIVRFSKSNTPWLRTKRSAEGKT
jgi:cellulose synthase/poly-beta-1,6-N-acetylglucosamine synthase-like glycosyltransferase